jgi:hypothetical protein
MVTASEDVPVEVDPARTVDDIVAEAEATFDRAGRESRD